MKDNETNITSPPNKHPLLKRLFKVLGYAIACIIGFFLLLYFILQIEFVQNTALKTATNYFSKELQTTVTFDRISLGFFDKLVLENFYAEDFHGDTLLYSEALQINLNTNLFKILNQELKVDDLTLSNAKLYMRRYPNQQKDDFAQLLDKLGGAPKEKDAADDKAKRPFFLDIDALYLRDIQFIKEDSVGGEELHIALKRGDIYVDSLNLEEKLVFTNSVELSKPYVTLINFPKNPIPEVLRDSIHVNIQTTIKGMEDSMAIDIQHHLLAQESVAPSKKWYFKMKDFALNQGIFIHHNYRKSPVKTSREDQIDYNHLNVYDINIEASDFTIQDWVFKGKSKHFSLKESSGFVLDNLSAEEALVTPRKVELYGMSLKTPYTNLGDTLVMKFREYPDFKDFPNKVYLNGDFDKASIAIRDIMAFSPALERNTFFAQNKNEVITIDGNIKGRINNLKGRNLHLKLGRRFHLKGNFNARNLTENDETFLSLKLEYLRTNMRTLRQLIPNFNPPENFDKLGKLDFKGRFDGFFNDFVTDGVLNTDLGVATMDMNLNSREGREQAQYSGQLSLLNFDLASWTGNDNFGMVTFNSKVYDGVGLTSQTADAKLQASIDHFEFKGYNYENLTLEGAINQNLFIGDFGIKDENIDFLFDGTINFEENIPLFNFHAEVNRVDFKKLNLLKDDFIISGDLDLHIKGNNVNDLQGLAALHDFTLLKDQTENYKIDSLKFFSAINQQRNKVWRINSEMFSAKLAGDFKATTIGESLLQFFENNFEAFANRFNIHSKNDSTVLKNQFDLDLEIISSKNFTALLDKKLDTLKNIHLNSYFDFATDSLVVDLEMPTFKYDNIQLDKVKLVSGGGHKEGKVDFSVLKTKVGKLGLDYISLLSYVENDAVSFNINVADLTHQLDNLNLEGNFALVGDQFNIELLPGQLVILNQVWDIEADNFIQIGKDFIRTQNFQINHEDQRIAINSIADKGIFFEMEGFNASYIDSIWDYKELDFEGKYRLDLEIEDVFALQNLQLNILSDTFNINQDNYGRLSLNAKAPNIKTPIDVRLTTENGDQQMELLGFYNPPSMAKHPVIYKNPNYVDVDVNITKYPLHLAEYFVTSGINNTVGNIDANLSLEGLLSDPDLDGTIRVYEGATTLEYTNTRYTIIDETVKMNNEFMIDATDGVIYDQDGNKATLEGGITHDFFSKLALDCRVYSDHFTVLNTQKGDNEVYYGKGIGKGDIRFSGDFNRTNIDIKATTARGTRVSMPISGGNTVEEKSFIRFVKIDTSEVANTKEKTKSNEIKGIQLHLELEMTDDAEVLLIFDEQAGDIMRGKGFGSIKMDMNRSGDISMYGNYEIETGEYLFTLMNLVNKPFTVKRGGTISWTGDPYNAVINIDADYKGLSTAPYNFILEYLNDDETKAEARKSTTVGLTMGLTGQLFSPNIAFKLAFPNLTGELKNYTDNKIRSIALDENELNTQVLGLIVFGNFLPTNQGALQSIRQSQIAINTLSELLSNQLSIYLTEIFSEGLSDIGFLALEDFDVNYNQYDASTIDNPNNLATGHEFSINPKFRVKDRWVVNIAGKANLGGGYVTNNEADALVTGDFIIEYELTKDRRLKIRGYYKNEPEIFGGRRNNAGVGLSFRKEFNDFEEIFSFLKKKKKEELSVIREDNLDN